jgi:hypothetical protein
MKLARGLKIKEHGEAVKARGRVPTIIDSISPEDLVAAIKRAPSLRGMILGYIAEEMFEKFVLEPIEHVNDVRKFDDHDRTSNKADRDFIYNNRRYTVQLKSIQTNSIVWRSDLQCLAADIQNDGSDKRDVRLPNGNVVQTTDYKIGDYDILAVPLYPFTGTWEFAYKRNSDCRITTSPKYSDEDRQYLLSTMEQITFPITDEWTTDLLSLCDDALGLEILSKIDEATISTLDDVVSTASREHDEVELALTLAAAGQQASI